MVIETRRTPGWGWSCREGTTLPGLQGAVWSGQPGPAGEGTSGPSGRRGQPGSPSSKTLAQGGLQALKDPVVHSLGVAGGHLPSTPVTLNHTGWCDPRETGSISDVLDIGSWRDQGGGKGRAGRPGGRTGAEPGGAGRGRRDPSPASCSTSTCLCPPCSLAVTAHHPPSPLSHP